jgi:hypothetical protein
MTTPDENSKNPFPSTAIHLRRDTDGYGYSTVTRLSAELTS